MKPFLNLIGSARKFAPALFVAMLSAAFLAAVFWPSSASLTDGGEPILSSGSVGGVHSSREGFGFEVLSDHDSTPLPKFVDIDVAGTLLSRLRPQASALAEPGKIRVSFRNDPPLPPLPDGISPRQIPAKRELGIPSGELNYIAVKFADELRVRYLGSGEISIAANAPVLASLAKKHDLFFVPASPLSPEKKEALRTKAMNLSATAQPDIGSMILVVAPDASQAEIVEIARRLWEMPETEHVSLKPTSIPAPTSENIEEITPNLTHLQSQYFPFLSNIDFIRNKAGIRGNPESSFFEIEWSIYPHEDVNFELQEGVSEYPDSFWSDHGIATMGVVSAVDNDFGMTGTAPEVKSFFMPCWLYLDNGEYQTESGAILAAAAQGGPGDAMNISLGGGPGYELEMQGFISGPCELDYFTWMAIKVATDAGIVVCISAGNSPLDLDHPLLEEYRSWGDSGSIIVSMGDQERRKVPVVAFGSRVNVHACYGVGTTGYQQITFGGDRSRSYTYAYSGTSATSPQAAGLALLAQSAYKQNHGRFLEPRELRDLLVSTGKPQADPENHIGPMIDAEAVTRAIVPEQALPQPTPHAEPTPTPIPTPWPPPYPTPTSTPTPTPSTPTPTPTPVSPTPTPTPTPTPVTPTPSPTATPVSPTPTPTPTPVPGGLQTLAGSYSGPITPLVPEFIDDFSLAADINGQPVLGSLSLTISPKGAYSLKINHGSASYSAKGKLNASGRIHTYVKAPSQKNSQPRVFLEVSNPSPNTQAFSGFFQNEETAMLALPHGIPSHLTSLDFTLIADYATGDFIKEAKAAGCAKRKGTSLRITARLPDFSPLLASASFLTHSGIPDETLVFFYQKPTKNRSDLSAVLHAPPPNFSNPELFGSIKWTSKTNDQESPNHLIPRLVPYSKPSLPYLPAWASLDGVWSFALFNDPNGNDPTSQVEAPLTFSKNLAKIKTPNLVLTHNLRSGTLSGTFSLPSQGSNRKSRKLLLAFDQQTGKAEGFVIPPLSQSSGPLVISPE